MPFTATLRAGAITITLQLLRFAANLGVSMLLARLLRPEDFGVFGMAMTVVGLLLLFRDGGVESAMIQRGRLEPGELASLLSYNLAFGCALACLCALCAPLLGWIYDEPRLVAPTLMLSLCFIVHGLDAQPGALLLRDHRFRAYAWVDFASFVIALLVSLVLALRGAGYWALFSMEVTLCLGLLIGHWRVLRWMPAVRGSWSSIRELITFGRDVSMVRALGHAAQNVDNALVGHQLGAAPLGFYSKAFRLVGMPQEGVNWPLSRIAIPTLSRLHGRPEAYRAAFRRFNFWSAALGMPWAVYTVACAAPIVRLVYGPQWDAAIPLVQILGAMGFLNTFLLAGAWVYVSTGTVRRQVRWEVLNLAVLAVAFAIGLRWGLTGVAAAASLSYAAIRIPSLLYCFRGTPVRLADLGAVLWRPAVASAFGAAGIFLAEHLVGPPQPLIARLLLDAAGLVVGYGLGLAVVPGFRKFLREQLAFRETTA